MYPRAISVLVTPPTLEPLTLAQAKLRAGFEWAPGDPREALLTGYIAAARAKVEQDTGLALLTQTRDLYLDSFAGALITLPDQSRPLQSVTWIKWSDTAGGVQTVAADQYVLDLSSGRIGLGLGGAWPTDLRPFQPIVIRVVVGYASVELLTAAAPLLVHAVGLLTAHYATLGRDLASIDPVTEIPHGYEDAIAAYRPVVVA